MPTSTFSVYSDEELLLFIAEGKVGAFDELYLRYSPRLMSYFVRMLNYDRNLAEDALQDLFLKIAQSPQSFKNNRSFKTWVYSIAHNSCKNYYRHKLVEEKYTEQFNYAQHNENNLDDLIKGIDQKQFKLKLEDALKLLSEEKRETFILRYQEEYSLAEIAEIQDCPIGSVKSRLHYALKILEEKLIVFKTQD